MLSSVAIIVAFTLLFQFLRRQLRSLTSVREEARDVLIWSLCSLELGCIAQEQGVLMEEAGLAAWAVSLVLVVTWQVVAWHEDGLSPNCLGNIVTLSRASLARVPAMLAGSLISYRLMSTLWLLELSPRHVSRAAQLSSSACRVPWSSRSLVAAMAAEFLGTLALSIIPRLYISSNPTLANNDPGMKVRGLLTGVLVLGVVLLGMEVSGAMYNPTLAAVLVGGCRGYSALQHAAVYWLAPVAAAFAAETICSKMEARGAGPAAKKLKQK